MARVSRVLQSLYCPPRAVIEGFRSLAMLVIRAPLVGGWWGITYRPRSVSSLLIRLSAIVRVYMWLLFRGEWNWLLLS